MYLYATVQEGGWNGEEGRREGQRQSELAHSDGLEVVEFLFVLL